MIPIQIKATGVDLTPAIDEYVRKRASTFEKLVSPEDTSARFSIEVGKVTDHHKSGDIFFAELNLHIAGKEFRARQEASDMYAAVDVAKDELTDAVRAHKGKRETLLRRGSQKVKAMLQGFSWRGRRLK